MSTRFDADAANRFLAQSRSPFLRDAAAWLTDFEDPVDVLFRLSREVGQAIGPWETFRFCALLGLTPAASVRELGEDVLAEPLDERSPEPPIAPAMALAHARAAYPELEAPYARRALTLVHEKRHAPGSNLALVASAQLALSYSEGACPDRTRFSDSMFACASVLKADGAAAVAGPILEAAVLSEDMSGLIDAAWAAIAAGQQDDGGVTALSEHMLVRGFATARVLALFKRAEAPARGDEG